MSVTWLLTFVLVPALAVDCDIPAQDVFGVICMRRKQDQQPIRLSGYDEVITTLSNAESRIQAEPAKHPPFVFVFAAAMLDLVSSMFALETAAIAQVQTRPHHNLIHG